MNNQEYESAEKQIFFLRLLLLLMIIVSLVLILSVNITTYAVEPNGRYYFSPSSASYQGCKLYKTNVMIELNEGVSSAADLVINYDPGLIQVTSTTAGQAYELHAVNSHDPSTGTIMVNGLTFVGEGFSGRALFLTLNFKSKPGVTTAGFNIYFTGVGNTTDSNIADSETSTDILEQVVNATYSFDPEACNPKDLLPPNTKPTTTQVTDPIQPSNTTGGSSTGGSQTPDESSEAPEPTDPEIIEEVPDDGKVEVIPGPLLYEIYVRGQYYQPALLPNIVQGDLIEVRGRVEPNQKVEVYVFSDTFIYEAVADDQGLWSLVINTQSFDPEVHNIQIRVLDEDNVLRFTNLSEFTVISPLQNQEIVIADNDTQTADRFVALSLGLTGVFLAVFGALMGVRIKKAKVWN